MISFSISKESCTNSTWQFSVQVGFIANLHHERSHKIIEQVKVTYLYCHGGTRRTTVFELLLGRSMASKHAFEGASSCTSVLCTLMGGKALVVVAYILIGNICTGLHGTGVHGAPRRLLC